MSLANLILKATAKWKKQRTAGHGISWSSA